MAHAVPIAPGAKLTDETLNVVVIGDLRWTELIPYYRAVRAQAHLSLPKVTTLEAQEVRIEAGQRVNVHCDDHIVGTTPVTISLAPKALRVLVESLASQG
jgi:diacylglycerol kinase family enzyme